MKQKSYMNGREAVRRGTLDAKPKDTINFSDLEKLGMGGYEAMDSAITGPAMRGSAMPVHLFEQWMPGTLRVITTLVKIDEILGIRNIGTWLDERIIQRISIPAGNPELYGDHSNVPLASFNESLEERGIISHELGFEVGEREKQRQNKIGYDATSEKRNGTIDILESLRNKIGFYGFSTPNSRTFGLLNDPNLPAYTTATGSWKTASFDDITIDLTRLFDQLEEQSVRDFNTDAQMTLVIPTGYSSVLNKTHPMQPSMTVKKWLAENYRNTRIIVAKEFEGANGGANVVYAFVESDNGATDDAEKASGLQIVPVKSQLIGSKQDLKVYIEDHLNSTAGVFILRPWLWARMSGI